MKRTLLVLSVLVASEPALAVERHNIDRMSCAQIQAMLRADGMAILRHKSTRDPSLTVYGPYVRDNKSCRAGFLSVRRSVPATDTNSCPVYQCTSVGRSLRR
jgi:hypothetical protein